MVYGEWWSGECCGRYVYSKLNIEVESEDGNVYRAGTGVLFSGAGYLRVDNFPRSINKPG